MSQVTFTEQLLVVIDEIDLLERIPQPIADSPGVKPLFQENKNLLLGYTSKSSVQTTLYIEVTKVEKQEEADEDVTVSKKRQK